MKNSQKGFVVPLLIIAVLVIGGGIYYSYSKKIQASQSNNINTQITAGNPSAVNVLPAQPSVILSPRKNAVLNVNDKVKVEWSPYGIVTKIQLLYGTSFSKDFSNIQPSQNSYIIDLKTLNETLPGGLQIGYGYSVKLFSDTAPVESGKFTISPSDESVAAKSRDDQRKRDVGQLQLAFQMYLDNKGFYPNSLSQLLPNIMPKVPVDPLDKTAYYYSIVSSGSNYILRVSFEQQITPFYNAKVCKGMTGRFCFEFTY
ncbi:MAG: hypothetical protein UW34_C0009G0004 [Parcubacteria group bacterium GW2011_GWA2_44_15]|nr:MAG: hypothetical protein UW34_C0009G0004 [Parcubacteria group bacterium GW2011_GWA2_44_15]